MFSVVKMFPFTTITALNGHKSKRMSRALCKKTQAISLIHIDRKMINATKENKMLH